ncbi:hypothetical protein TNCV_3950621 [Trichonephila clavipes]|nr:hypothetical protein TNCV_3950621 [Trichonephila clavipes]
MAFLGKGSKVDLQVMTTEMGVEDVLGLKVVELKEAILNSKYFDEELCREYLNTIIEERKRKRNWLREKEKKSWNSLRGKRKEETGRFRADDEECRNRVRTPEKTNRIGRRRSFRESMPRHRSVVRQRQHWK